MKLGKIFAILFLLLVLSIPGFFVYTRFLLEQYHGQADRLTSNTGVYVRTASLTPPDEKNIGSTIGIAIYGERTITDLIWPYWVMEFQDDKDHNCVFVQGLMDLGQAYCKPNVQ